MWLVAQFPAPPWGATASGSCEAGGVRGAWAGNGYGGREDEFRLSAWGDITMVHRHDGVRFQEV
ncbi:hypothetical protein ACFOSC_13035 [Streptantibioticus rubrisoli]|uniref:Uncharacterized protein n=1 Tax=Streptantibioticus rubrisoli TaxID=1387313 RepID=A0ABT1PAV5_9ACTN|nr:hypothetical protein [Streptantibioticus rubrisoli]MCQ4041445.1 hypothetical protein [Streptantibioticus rubrisoli]